MIKRTLGFKREASGHRTGVLQGLVAIRGEGNRLTILLHLVFQIFGVKVEAVDAAFDVAGSIDKVIVRIIGD